MSCNLCTALVEKNIGKLQGVVSVKADLPTGKVTIVGTPDPAAVRHTIEDLGFTTDNA